jgi:hypothetical protein
MQSPQATVLVGGPLARSLEAAEREAFVVRDEPKDPRCSADS